MFFFFKFYLILFKQNFKGKDQLITSQKSILSLTVKNATVVSTDDVDIRHLLDVVLNNQPVTAIYSDLMIKGMFFGNRIVANGTVLHRRR